MRLPQAILFLLTLFTTIHALTLPSAFNSFTDSTSGLFKRKGGGGGGGKSGGGSSGGSSGGGSKSGSGGSSSGSSSGSSNGGGRSGSGSGTRPSYGGGRYYGGGASVPYTSGGRSPAGITPFFIGGAALVAVPFLLAGSYYYAYPYHGYWAYHNNTANRNESYPAQCYCEQYQECGCDDNDDDTYRNSVANDNTIAAVTKVNNTDTLVIDGTLDNGTTAAGGAAALASGSGQLAGWSVVVAGVVYTMWLM